MLFYCMPLINKEASVRNIILATLTTALLATASQSYALTASQIVEKEVVVQQPDGTERVIREAADMVTPGERVVYTLNFTNDDAQPATDLVLTMPIPQEVRFMEGTASKTNMVPVFSADGGNNFSTREQLQIRNGDGNLRSATSGDITHIRWTVPGPIAVGETGNLSFKGVLR